MLYRNNTGDLIYLRESDGKKFLIMEGTTIGGAAKKETYDVAIVFEWNEGEEQDLGNVAAWFYGVTFADDGSFLDTVKEFVGC